MGGIVFVASATAIHALDATTGAERWTTPVEHAVPLLRADAGRVLGAGSSGAIAVDASSGRVLWTQAAQDAGEPSGIASDRDALYVTFRAERAISLSITDGAVRWRASLPGVLGPPAVSHERVFIGSTDRRLYALDSRSGKVRWSWRTGGDVPGAAADARFVYYVSLDNVVRAVNPGNGNQRWKRDGGTRPLLPPLALDGSILVTGLSPTLSAFAPATGAPLGTYTAPGEILGGPLITPTLQARGVGLIVVLKDGRVIGLRPTGLLFDEMPSQPFSALPGHSLQRERLPGAVRP